MKNTQALLIKMHQVNKKRWKLAKSLLRNFEWNPFRKLTKEPFAEVFYKDTISIEKYDLPNTKITHQKIYHTSLDIIYAHHKSFGSLNCIQRKFQFGKKRTSL